MQIAADTGKHLNRWLPAHARRQARRWFSFDEPRLRHIMFALCDHFEPLWAGASEAVARARVERWLREYPRLAHAYCDADGRSPRHTFFFPAEQYRAHTLRTLAELGRSGLSEVELHLHHDRDTEEGLRRTITDSLARFAEHGHLSRGAGERLRYAFIHGNWCLANSRADGRWCGVNTELEVLFETGCYADFTFPSAPDETQPKIIDQIYWPVGDPTRARAHEIGVTARVGEVMHDRILMIQGPLALSRGGRFGLRIENAALTAKDPATPRRVRSWIRQAVHVEGRPEWIFVKAHTHGAPDAQAASLLGAGGHGLHAALAEFNDGERFRLHYVTAREMFNIALAAMEGRRGDPNLFRDHRLAPPPVTA